MTRLRAGRYTQLPRLKVYTLDHTNNTNVQFVIKNSNQFSMKQV